MDIKEKLHKPVCDSCVPLLVIIIAISFFKYKAPPKRIYASANPCTPKLILRVTGHMGQSHLELVTSELPDQATFSEYATWGIFILQLVRFRQSIYKAAYPVSLGFF